MEQTTAPLHNSTIPYSCTTSIDRWKAGPANYEAIIASGAEWNDTQFPMDSTAYSWFNLTGANYTRASLISARSNTFLRLKDKYPTNTLFGTSNSRDDIVQGGLGDCYFLAAISAYAENDSRFQQNFVNKNQSGAGIWALNVWIRGVPSVVTIDDRIPGAGKSFYYAGLGVDGSLWGPILEKAFAKYNQNYEKIEGGMPSEGFEFLGNAMTTTYYLS